MNALVYEKIKEIPRAVYDEQDLNNTETRWRRCLIAGVCCLVLLIAATSVTLVYRNKIATMATGIVFAAAFIFFWNLKAEPVRNMRKHLSEVHSGLTKTTRGKIVSLGSNQSETIYREGLEFFALILNVGDSNDEKDERLFYWNAGLDVPKVSVGDSVEITSHGNDIIGFTAIV
jgi:hypothetical protein